MLIRTTAGEAVSAAAAGDVVYAGIAISAYGPLVIIRHNN
jgi:septal ring factor EnvC (AmiA/AmiB activator)